MTPHNARGQGRKPIPEEERLVLGSIRLSEQQWKLFRAIGGASWLRDNLNQIRAARMPGAFPDTDLPGPDAWYGKTVTK
jgi:hypothetical protein